MIHSFRATITRLFTVACLIISLSGCSTFEGMFDSFSFFEGSSTDQVEDTPTSLIITGMNAYQNGEYKDGLKSFEKIITDYPFSSQAPLAELKAADCYFYLKQYPEAKNLYLSFAEKYPRNDAIPYVIYQTGRCGFNKISRIDKDTSGAKEAIKTFSRLLRLYPDSPYSEDAKRQIKDAKDFLANHEYFVAEFYARNKKYDQAKHRLRYLINMYPEAKITEKAQGLLKRLENNNPPSWGLSDWLPRKK